MSGQTPLPPTEEQMDAKYFIVTRSDTGDLVVKIARKAAGGPIPPETISFLQRLQFADSQIRDPEVVPDPAQRTQFAFELLSYAQTGLQHGDLTAAGEALRWFETRVADQIGPDIRRKHLLETLKIGAAVGLPALAVSIIIPHIKTWIPQQFSNEIQMLQAGLLMAAGNSLGIVFFAFFRNLELKFDQLAKFDPAKLDPKLRFTMVWIVTMIFAVVLASDVLQVGLGGQLLNEFLEIPLMALIVGILCGYSDTTISNLLAGVFDRPEKRGQEPQKPS